MRNLTHKNIFASVRSNDVFLAPRVTKLKMIVKHEDIYAYVIPEYTIDDVILDMCNISALDNVSIETLDPLHFYDIYRGEA